MVIPVLYPLVRCLPGCLTVLTRHRVPKDTEILVLRHENAVSRRPHRLVPRRDHAQNRAEVAYDFTDGRLMLQGLPSHEDADRRLSNCREIQQGGVLTH